MDKNVTMRIPAVGGYYREEQSISKKPCREHEFTGGA